MIKSLLAATTVLVTTLGFAGTAVADEAPTKLYFVPVGTIVGGTASVTNPEVPHSQTPVLNGVGSTESPDQSFTFNVGTDTTSIAGRTVTAVITARVSGSGTSANDATLTVNQSGSNSAQGSVILHNPNAVTGDAFKITASIDGTAVSSVAWMLYEAPTVNLTPAPTETNSTLGSSFPASRGTITLTPPVQTTPTRSGNEITALITDQFGHFAHGSMVWAVTGRNTVNQTIATGPSASQTVFDWTDAGPSAQESSLNDPNSFDTVSVFVDSDGNGLYAAGSETKVLTGHYYTVGAPTVEAIEGGIGTATEQFGTSSPYAPVTNDDVKTVQIDETHDYFNQTFIDVFFEVRTATNRRLPGQQIQLSITNAYFATSNPLTQPSSITVIVGTDGIARAKVAQGFMAQTSVLTASVGSASKQLTLNWDNTGYGRFIGAYSPAQNGSVTPSVSVLVSDRHHQGVPGTTVHLSLSGPGTFSGGASTTDVITGINGSVFAPVLATGEGLITLTADAVGTHFTDAADTPVAGDQAGFGHTVISFSSSEITGATNSNPATRAILTFSKTTAPVNGGVLVKAQVAGDEFSVPGISTQLSYTRAGSNAPAAVSAQALTDGNGFIVWAFTSSEPGTVTIHVTVFDPNARELPVTTSKTVTFTAVAPPKPAAPKLSQTNSGGVVVLKLTTDKTFNGKNVVFYRRSGLTGVVVPEGGGTVDRNGTALRVLHEPHGKIMAIYSKLLGVTNIQSPYSNTITFKVS